MSLTIEDAEDDVTQTRYGDAASQSLCSFTTSKVYQMES